MDVLDQLQIPLALGSPSSQVSIGLCFMSCHVCINLGSLHWGSQLAVLNQVQIKPCGSFTNAGSRAPPGAASVFGLECSLGAGRWVFSQCLWVTVKPALGDPGPGGV